MSKDMYHEYPRLAHLLERLCDERLDQAEADELSQIVTSDARACRFYVTYMELHANLQWDLALPALGEDVPVQASLAMKHMMHDLLEEAGRVSATSGLWGELHAQPVQSPASRRKTYRVMASLAASVLLLLGGVFFLLPREHFTMTVEHSQPAEETNPVARISSDSVPDSPSVAETPPALPAVLPELTWGNSPLHEAPATAVVGPSPPGESRLAVNRVYSDEEVIAAIDRQIASGWDDMRLTSSPLAEDHEWVRRVYLDLAGRIPTAEEVERYVASGKPTRREELVDLLLSSPEFSLQWSSRWTNLLVGRTPNDQVDRVALQAYLRKSIEDKYGWSQVVQELISSEGNPRDQGAANFLVAHLNNQAVPATAFVARTLLGTQIHCAQCHKHPFYEVSQQEFWELNSFFKQATVVKTSPLQVASAGDAPAVYSLLDRKVGGPTYFETRTGVMKVAYPRFQGMEIDTSAEVPRRRELARLLTQGEDPLIARAFVNRTWSHLFGYGFTTPVDDLGPHNPPTHPALFSTLTTAFVQHGYDVKRLTRWLCLSRPYRLSSRLTSGNQADRPDNGEVPAFSRMYFKPLSSEQLYDSLLVLKGEYPHPRLDWKTHVLRREDWVAQFISSLQNDENDESSHFDGTISQALVMMNGDLVESTISPRENPLLHTLISAPLADVDKLERLCLSVLSRRPHAEELAVFRKLTRPIRDARTPAEREAQLASRLEDFLWAYLNSSEFIMNH
ncbi:MAG: DUF1553 domain-containing protein [Planctomycetaceae bacterium]|nr:DUF1553 domain-containing protein [Planctomycetaceae bacterium]